MDALNTTAEIAHAIVNAGGLYLLAVKNNQPKLNRAVKKAIAEARKKEICPKGVETNHCRVEKRRYVVAPANTLPAPLLKTWPGLEKGCVIRAETQGFRENKNGEWRLAKETRWFITCYPYPFVDEQATSEVKAKAEATIEWLGACVRNHWGIETTHWIIDWTWRQDQMECQYPGYLRARETLAKIGHNLLVLLQQIDHRERGTKNPRSEHELSKLVAVTVEDGLRWLRKITDLDLAKA